MAMRPFFPRQQRATPTHREAPRRITREAARNPDDEVVIISDDNKVVVIFADNEPLIMNEEEELA
jgi:hypothetical protein